MALNEKMLLSRVMRNSEISVEYIGKNAVAHNAIFMRGIDGMRIAQNKIAAVCVVAS